MAYSGIFVGGLYWVINHLLRYQGSDVTITTVFFFGLIMALITILTGSFIPAWIMHISNNFFIDVQRFYSSDTVFIYSIIFLILMVVTYGFIYRGRWFGGKRGGE